MWAKVARPPRQAGTRDRPAAARTRLPRPPVDAELFLVAALQPRAADVIADARAALLDRVVQHGFDRLAQAVRLGGAEAAAGAGGVEAGGEQRLVGVDVAHAGDDVLVQQHRLEAAVG